MPILRTITLRGGRRRQVAWTDEQVTLKDYGKPVRQLSLFERRHWAANAEHYLARHLNAYLDDEDEYRAITRETIIRGLAGTITYTPKSITVTLDRPGQGRVARALTLLLAEINTRPPKLPGDGRPITYTLRQP